MTVRAAGRKNIAAVWVFVAFFLLTGGLAQADRLSMVKQLSLSGTQTRILKDGPRVYLAAGAAGVHIVDVSDPTSPTLLGTLDTTGTAQGFAIAGANLYVADGQDGLVIADVSKPAAPKIIGAYDTPGYAQSVVTSGTLAFVADSEHGLQIIDVSNAARPVKVGSCDTMYDQNLLLNSSDRSDTTDVMLKGPYAYLADGLRLMIVDLSNIHEPALLAWRQTNYAYRFCAGAGNWLYLCSGGRGYGNGPTPLDLANPVFPIVYPGGMTYYGRFDSGASNVGSFLYIANLYNGLELVDVSIPNQPASHCRAYTNGNATDVVAEGDLAYVANGTGGLAILRRQPAPFLRFLSPGGNNRGIDIHQSFKIRWDSQNLAGNVTIKVLNGDVNSPVIHSVSGIPVSQGATGYDMTIPPDKAAQMTWGYASLRLESADGLTTAGLFSQPINTAPNETTPPAVTIEGSAPGLGTHANETVIYGTAYDNNSSVVALVELRVDGGAWQAIDRLFLSRWQKVLTLGKGQHTIEARSRDYAGNYSPLASRTVDLAGYDRFPPVIQVDQPHDLEVLTGTCTLTVSGTASDPGTTTTGVSSVMLQFNNDWNPITLAGTTKWVGQVRLVHGLNTFTFYAYDGSTALYWKNRSLLKTMSVFYNPPLSKPSVAITAPTNKQTIAAKTVRVTGTAAGGGAAVDLVEVRVNGGAWTLAQGTTSWHVDCPLAPGFNTIEAHAIDARNYVSDPAAVTVNCQPASGIIYPRGSLGGMPAAIRLKGTSTVLMSEGTRVLVLNASNESKVTKLSAMDVGDLVNDLAVDGNLVYIAAGTAGLQIYDLTDPAHPRWRGGYRDGKTATAVAVSGGVAYLRNTSTPLVVFDVSNPDAPRLVKTLDLGYGSTAGAVRLVAAGSRLLLGQAGSSLVVMDISTPTNPVKLFTCGASSNKFVLSGNTVILLNSSTLMAYDLGNPGTALGMLTLSGTIADVQDSGPNLLALRASGALDVINGSNPASLKLVTTLTNASAGIALAATSTRGYAATADGLKIFDIRSGSYGTVGGYAMLGTVLDVAPAGSVTWVAGTNGMLAAVNLANPDDPAVISMLATPRLTGQLRAGGGRVYIPYTSSSQHNIAIVDATNPANPVLTAGKIGAPLHDANDLAVNGNLVYVAEPNVLEVYDCSNPNAPVRVTSVNLITEYSGDSSTGYLVERVGSILMVALRYKGVEFFDLTDPRNPVHAAAYYGPVRSAKPTSAKPMQGLEYGLPVNQMAADGKNLVLTSSYCNPLLLECPTAGMPRQLAVAPSSLASYLYPAVSRNWVALARTSYSGSPNNLLNLFLMSPAGVLMQVDTNPVPVELTRMRFAGKILCLVSGTKGLRLLQVNFPTGVNDWSAYE